jgi:hypothetical protein
VQRHVGNQALACAGKVVHGVFEQHDRPPFSGRKQSGPSTHCRRLWSVSSHLWPLL